MKLMTQTEAFNKVRRPVFLEHRPKVERPEKGCGYRRRPKHRKDRYEAE